jgi:DNA-binding PadR family transcriptional regulator
MATSPLERELKRGSTEVLILALLDERQRHGYEINQLIEERSNGTITFHTASLYPTLYRLEEKGLIAADEARRTRLTDGDAMRTARHSGSGI